MPRNPKNINYQLDADLTDHSICQLYGGFEDGEMYLVSDAENELRLPTRCGNVKRIAVYVRINTDKFGFEGYE